MKIKTIIVTLLVCFSIVGLLFWGYISNSNTSASVSDTVGTETVSSLESTTTFHDFGTISMKNGNVSKDFVFTNSTQKDVVIKGIETSCMCTQAFLVALDGFQKGPFGMSGMGGATSLNEIVRPGEVRTLRVVYDPNAHGPAGVGSIDRFVTITDSSNSRLRYEIKAVVTP
jgi:hypothetical protein